MLKLLRRFALIMVVLSSSLFVACGQDEPVDTLADFSKARHVFEVEFPFPTPERKIRTQLGMQGSSAAVIPGDPDIVESYQSYGFEMVRLPQDDFCTYTLEGIFQDAEAAESERSSYEFGNIDRLISGITSSGAQVLWQATHDIGIDAGCGETEGRHSGDILADPTKHVNVVNNVLRHFNEGESDWDPEGQSFDVRYVEYINDPMGLGGYGISAVDKYFEDFQIFSLGIRAAFNGLAGNDSIKIVAPAHRVRSWPAARTAEKAFIYDLIDKVADEEIALDVLSLQFRMGDPYELARIVDDIRTYLDNQALVEIPIWITELAPEEEYDASLRKASGLEHQKYVGAHLIAAKIAWQETVDRIFPHRGTRRYEGADGDILESAFFDVEGNERGGLLGFNAFRKIESHTILRGSAVTSDGVALLASRAPQGNSISILVSFPGWDDAAPQPVPILLSSLPEEIESFDWEFSEPSEFAPFIFQIQERGTLSVLEGVAEYSFLLKPSGVARLDLSW